MGWEAKFAEMTYQDPSSWTGKYANACTQALEEETGKPKETNPVVVPDSMEAYIGMNC